MIVALVWCKRWEGFSTWVSVPPKPSVLHRNQPSCADPNPGPDINGLSTRYSHGARQILFVISFHNQILEPSFFSPVSSCRCCICGGFCAVLSLPVLSSGITSCDVQTGGGATGGCSCCCFNGSCKSSFCSSPLASNSTLSLQASTTIHFRPS